MGVNDCGAIGIGRNLGRNGRIMRCVVNYLMFRKVKNMGRNQIRGAYKCKLCRKLVGVWRGFVKSNIFVIKILLCSSRLYET